MISWTVIVGVMFFGLLLAVILAFIAGIDVVSNRLSAGMCQRLLSREKNPMDAVFCRRCGMPLPNVNGGNR